MPLSRHAFLETVRLHPEDYGGAGTLLHRCDIERVWAIVHSLFGIAAGRGLQALLAGVSPTDFVTFGAAVALALAMTALGSLLPALKAVRVDPLQVMRGE